MLEAVINELESKAADEVSMTGIAESAGVSLRTLYRYFPGRASLLQAAGQHLCDSLGVPFEISGAETISVSLLDAAQRLSTPPELTCALVRTTAGRTIRSPWPCRRGRTSRGVVTSREPVPAGTHHCLVRSSDGAYGPPSTGPLSTHSWQPPPRARIILTQPRAGGKRR